MGELSFGSVNTCMRRDSDSDSDTYTGNNLSQPEEILIKFIVNSFVLYHKDDHSVSSQNDDVNQQQDDKKDHLFLTEVGEALDDEKSDAIRLPGAVNRAGSQIGR